MRFARPLAVALAAVTLALALAPAASAGEPKCPLPLHECLARYTHMRERPWLGAIVATDSVTGARSIDSVVEGGPAQKAGLRAGDVLKSIGGVPPETWFAGKAGWKSGGHARIEVVREGGTVALEWALAPIPEERLAQMMGLHLLEGHLAYGDLGEAPADPHRH